VIETGDLGEVMNIEGSGDDLRFVVDLYPKAGGSRTLRSTWPRPTGERAAGRRWPS
jgi:hypothetical protein